ncbi:MAG: hypothetical protein ACJ79R_13100 [Anaeromyxobacteraceae bacterium]
MRTQSSLLAVIAASITALATGDARADTTWTFTGVNPRATYAVASPKNGVDAMVFHVTASAVAPMRLVRMAFQVMGTVQSAEVTNYELVYYPTGLGTGGVVVGSNTGAAFAPGGRTSIVSVDVATPIALQGNFAGFFALRAAVQGTRAYFVTAQLQTVTLEDGGVERFLMETEDLPMSGDTYYVN